MYWDHLIEKSPRPDLAFEEWNLIFLCGECHSQKTNGFAMEKHKELIKKAQQRDGNKDRII